MSDHSFSIEELDLERDLGDLAPILGNIWELKEVAGSCFDTMSALYVVEGFAGSNWIRVARSAGHTVGFIGALIPHIGYGSWYTQSMNMVKLLTEELKTSEDGRKVLDIHAELVKFNTSFSKEAFPDFPKDTSEVQLFFVDKAHQRQGIGSALMELAIEETAKHRMHRMIVVSDAKSNWRYYGRHGWNLVLEKKWEKLGHHNYGFDRFLDDAFIAEKGKDSGQATNRS